MMRLSLLAHFTLFSSSFRLRVLIVGHWGECTMYWLDTQELNADLIEIQVCPQAAYRQHAQKPSASNSHLIPNLPPKDAIHCLQKSLCHVLWPSCDGFGPTLLVCHHCFCSASMTHSSCHRPVSGGVCVLPSELRRYRATHQYLGPGCLCPLLEPLSKEPAFTEAAIYLTIIGRDQGEYVAECAKGRCGYLG